jgi:hypothetical protein
MDTKTDKALRAETTRSAARSRKQKAEALIGKAFLGPDGLVRWVTGLSVRGYLHELWLDGRTGVWHTGGGCKLEAWEKYHAGPEVPRPLPGETYKRAGATGMVSEYVAEFTPKREDADER